MGKPVGESINLKWCHSMKLTFHTYVHNIFLILQELITLKLIAEVIKPGAPGFLKLILCGHLYVCLCVRPEAINN